MLTFNQLFDATQVQNQLSSVVDRFEQSTNTVIGFMQPESMRTNAASLNHAYYEFARNGIKNAVTFADVVTKTSEVVGNMIKKTFTK